MSVEEIYTVLLYVGCLSNYKVCMDHLQKISDVRLLFLWTHIRTYMMHYKL